MRKAIFLVLFFLVFSVRPALASENWKNLPTNTCTPYPTLSACNLSYIMETNVSILSNLVVSGTGGIASGIGYLYQNPPVSTRDYLSYMGNHFHVPGTPTQAYAANDGGLGYNKLNASGVILKFWVVMRNLAYFIFAILFVVIGIMILIRSKIDPKTTLTIQNALPKIITALVLVTFSYAIAGFLIDLMYVSLALVITIVGAVDTTILSGTTSITTATLGTNILNHNLFWGFFADWSMWDAIGNAGQAINILLQNFITGSAAQGITGSIGTMLTGIAGGIAGLVIAIAVLIALFKAWLSLLGAYANIILGIIFSPIQLMMDAIPGQSQFSGWLKNMLAYILSFPAVLAMILIGVILAKSNGGNDINPATGFSPPLIGASNPQAISSLIGIAIILTIPKAIDMIQEAIKSPKSKFGSAWGENLGAGQRVVGAGVGGGYQSTVGKLTEGARLQEQGYQKVQAENLARSGDANFTPSQVNRPGLLSRIASKAYKGQG